jgi:hypothetical protein
MSGPSYHVRRNKTKGIVYEVNGLPTKAKFAE